jgi:nucleoside diphosphate kinase
MTLQAVKMSEEYNKPVENMKVKPNLHVVKNKKAFIGLELVNGSTAMLEIRDYAGESEKELLDTIRGFLALNKGNFIVHGSRVVNVDNVVSAFVEIREN